LLAIDQTPKMWIWNAPTEPAPFDVLEVELWHSESYHPECDG